MKHQKKCPGCGEWSTWYQSHEDICEHCGTLLSPEAFNRDERRAEYQAASEKKWIFYIEENDGPVLRFFKKIGNTVYLIYMAILTFIMWLIAVTPG
ncbi:MAG: hypothetical protein JJU28_24235 [Cyclobacteriaceae bacterium]|nr:hypothetical protein [Cyclobacteriaceae bacterium]